MHQTFAKNYMTGFDRMLTDKLSFLKVGSWWFALFGILNGLAYGASLIMPQDWYRFHFAYTGYPARMFKSIKSQIGSDTFANVVWTAPSLILVNWHLQGKISPLVMTKFFGLSLFVNFIFLSAANSYPQLNKLRPARAVMPKWDSFADDGSYTMGADQMVQSLFYFTLCYHRYWLPALAIASFDVLYYGPASLGGPFAGFAGALMFL